MSKLKELRERVERAHPWDENEHGLWCSACGYHVAAPWNMEEEGYEPPMTCRQCGFPDFEDGPSYFLDDVESSNG